MAERMVVSFVEGGSAPKDALFRRIATAFERIADDITDEMALAALAAPSDLGSLARLLSDERLNDPALQIDPMASVLARSVQHREILFERAKPTLSAEDAAGVLGISRQAVDKRRAGQKLLALRVQGDWRYPEFQFTKNGVVPGFEDLLAAYDGQDPWVILDALTAKDSAFDGRSLIEVLRAGDTERVDRALRQMTSDGYA